MENLDLAVGTLGCSIQTVVSVIKEDSKITDNWTSLARCLDISNAVIKKLQQDLLLNKISYSDMFCEVLEQWVSIKGEAAKLSILILVMEEECKAVTVAESIRHLFNLPTSIYDLVSWESLPKVIQERALNNLHKLIPNMSSQDIKPTLNGIVLGQLIKGISQTLPESLSYYVTRTVHTRNTISPDIFGECHIFLVSEIERNDLSKFAKDETTDNSRDQILQGKLTVRFLKLDSPHHFDKICKLTNDPVHWFSFEGNKLKWIQSQGGISTVQEFVDKSQDSLHEEDFVTSFLLDSNQPICISDSPGMGKSVFLAEIGRKLVDQYPDRTVIFLALGEFIKTIKEIEIEPFLQQITESSNENAVSIELLLDGFDEVDSSDREFAHELLRRIRTSCKSIRMWVTSRPHLLDQLERTLDTIGFNLQPFSVDDQVRFLTSYWLAMNPNIKNQNKLITFANHSLTTLKSTVNSEDIDIAGVPLQCLLIAEVYEEEALVFSNSKQSTSPTILIISITDLYKSLIERKFQKCAWTESEAIMNMHARLSLELIFPEQFKKLKHLFGPVEMEKILKIGILQASSSSTVPRFLHRTFAEYFAAWFVGDRLKNRIADEHFVDFCISRALQCNTTDRYTEFRYFESGKFTHDVIAYFLNSLMNSVPNISTTFTRDTMSLSNLEYITQNISWACVRSNRLQIFILFMELTEMEKDEDFAQKMLFDSLEYCSLEFVKTVLEQFEKHHSFDADIQLKTFHIALKRGKFSIVEFFIKERQLQRIVKEVNSLSSDLLPTCIKESSEDSSLKIDNKIQIIRMLSELNPAIVDMEDQGGTTPLLSNHVHTRLRTELIRLGANVLNVAQYSETVLHLDYGFRRDLRSSQSIDFHLLILTIPEESLKRLVRAKDSNFKVTPLHNILSYFDPAPATIDVLKKVGADFNFVDNNGFSPLARALIYKRSGATIRKLIQCGADVHWKKGWKRKSLLHIAAGFLATPESVAVLLEWIDPNVRDLTRKTPMEYAREMGDEHVDRFKQGLLLSEKK